MKEVRCAIYTRKSTEEGLDKEFNTLEAQREAGENYVLSQKHQGWKIIPEHYDDGGFSGGNMNRPALERLLEDINAGKVDMIVVYKIDRLTRSLTDFSKMIEILEKNNCSFVSVTQNFNTADSMGRLIADYPPTTEERKQVNNVNNEKKLVGREIFGQKRTGGGLVGLGDVLARQGLGAGGKFKYHFTQLPPNW